MQLEVNVEKQFNDFQCSFRFSLNNGKCRVFGPSGSGKSTLMNMLSGTMAPDKGKITLNGTDLFDSQRRINLPPDKRRAGVVFQHAHLFPHMSVKKIFFMAVKEGKVNRPK